jgi:phosphoribosyl 1,2-cyclic phosphodiesterase
MDKVKAIFVSHEHSDHITGIPVLARKFQLPVYITEGTRTKGRLFLEKHLVISFRAHIPIQFSGFSVTAFPKFHDAFDPHSFIVASASVKVGIFTDIGIACDQVIRYFQQCHAAFLEANYDEDMLTNGSYPSYLKRRIKGGTGHLSNAQALQLVLSYKPRFMSHLLLSHLSKNNNNPKLVEELFNQHAENTKIIVASRNKETPVYHITDPGIPPGSIKKKYESITQLQLSLF